MARDDRGRFQKGGPGNTHATGRPPIARSLSDAIRARGHEVLDAKTGETRFDKLAVGLWDVALNHEDADVRLRATKEIGDRTEGRPAQKIDVTSNGQELIKGYPSELLDKVT